MSRTDTFLTVAMRAREHAHRRMVLWGIGVLVLLSLSPVVGHHVSARVDAAVMGYDHVWTLCLIALHSLLGPVHTGFHVLLAAGVLYAVWDRLSAMMRLRRTLCILEKVAEVPSAVITDSARRAGIALRAIRIVPGLPNPAFTAGWWAPVIYLARELEHLLSAEELIAVLAHEAEHRRRRDPLRLSLLRFLACTLFWIPAFRRLVADMADEAEIDADDAAARTQPLVLASAILSLASWKSPLNAGGGAHHTPAGGVVGLVENGGPPSANHDALLERRVRRLAGETAAVPSRLTRRSLFGAAATLAMVWVSGIVVAHPMPAMNAHASHCEHAGASALSHLFCRGGVFWVATDAKAPSGFCPHQTAGRA